MNKIIIDGVDVAKCAYITYKESDTPICSETGQYCRGYDICYYKQLKQLEQELITEPCDNSALGILREIKAENKFLKEENAKLKENYRLSCLDCEYKNTKATVDKYNQVLQEIKEIAEKTYDIPCNNEYSCDDCLDDITNCGETCLTRGHTLILKKISEVVTIS